MAAGAVPTPEWMEHAVCRVERVPTEVFFPSDGDTLWIAKSVCERCPVRRECLHHAIANREDDGIWGGESERSRQRIRRRGLTIRQTMEFS